jgi:hypothetical protein
MADWMTLGPDALRALAPSLGPAAQERIRARLAELEARAVPGGGVVPSMAPPAAVAGGAPLERKKRPQAGRKATRVELDFRSQVLAPRLEAGVSVLLLADTRKRTLAERVTYRPDAMEVLRLPTEAPDVWWCWEVKGPQVWEDGKLKFRMAARVFPTIRWTMVQRRSARSPWECLDDRGGEDWRDLVPWPEAVLR